MIITINGMPCAGKSTCIEIMKNKYGFDVIYTGEIYRQEAAKAGLSVLDFNKLNRDYSVDRKIDERTREIGTERANDKLIFDSRMAWYFVPKSFKVYFTLPEDVMAKRLFESDRNISEKYNTYDEAKKSLVERYQLENSRYLKLYGVDKGDFNNYDFIIDNSNLKPEETADIVYNEYIKFLERNN